MTIQPVLAPPDCPLLAAGHARGVIITTDGEIIAAAALPLRGHLDGLPPPMLVHAPATWRRLGGAPRPALDLLELFAFALPARPVTPTARGLCLALDLDPPAPGPEAAAACLADIALALLRRIAAQAEMVAMTAAPANPAALAARMGLAGWLWADSVLAALGNPRAIPGPDTLRAYKRLPQWEDQPPAPPPSAHAISGPDARARLSAILGPNAEQRPGQADYAAAVAAAFAPRQDRGDPVFVLAEAGTGIGKTLGYIAPASLWAERNQSTVWVSTFTRHLQRQIGAELARLFPDRAERRRRVVVRKGRENYLCLLNLDEALAAAGASAPTSRSPLIVPLGLLSRWLLATEDGDLQGGDLPGWFAELFGAPLLAGLADRRGECLHGGCTHWRRCFVEHTIRRARTADIVVANHALVMSQASWGGLDDDTVPTRYVFDEGHHLFDAADGAFSASLTGQETAELRRWLLGAEDSRSRAKGLRARLAEITAGRPDLEPPLDAALTAARALARPGWTERLDTTDNPTESLLALLRRQILARDGRDDPRSGTLEADLHPIAPEIPAVAAQLERAYARLMEPLATLRDRLRALLDDEADELDEATRSRIDAAARQLDRRALARLAAWREMLDTLSLAPPEPGTRPAHIHLLRLERWADGRGSADRKGGDRDAGLHRHWLDPTIPFVATLAQPAHGLLVTSATLRDEALDPPPHGPQDDGDDDDDAIDRAQAAGQAAERAQAGQAAERAHAAGQAAERAQAGQAAERSWTEAEARIGANHLPSPAIRAAVRSPFDYAGQTRCLVATDVAVDDAAQLASAYRALFEASGGGALGLFTAISRLRATHARIAAPLEATGLSLHAQHVDPMDNSTLVDILRSEPNACLLGTDAMRDGVDVPGRALRLVVFDRVPWARPDILHRERRTHLSAGDPGSYDDRVARMRLRQAFGRLVRRATDTGIFVLLDRRVPTRLLSAFPAGVTPRRMGLAEIIAQTRSFIGDAGQPN